MASARDILWKGSDSQWKVLIIFVLLNYILEKCIEIQPSVQGHVHTQSRWSTAYPLKELLWAVVLLETKNQTGLPEVDKDNYKVRL